MSSVRRRASPKIKPADFADGKRIWYAETT